MNLNATIFVQAFNFFIAYLLMRWLLFKPAVEQIQAEEHEQQSLHNALINEKKFIEYQHKIRIEHWQQCHQFFLTEKPDITLGDLYIFKNITPKVSIGSPLLTEALRTMIEQAAHEIEKKVGA